MTLEHRPLRVVHLVSTLNVGGLEMVVLDLTRSLDRARFESHVLCLGEVGQLGPRFEAEGVPVESLGAFGSGKMRSVARLARKLRELRPDILHTHNPAPHLRGVPAARIARVPILVHTKHGRNDTERWRAVAANRFAAMLSTCIVPVSEDAAEVARRIERIPSRKIQVIRNGIDLLAFNADRPRRREPGRRAIHVGRLNIIKDQVTLLHAAKGVADVLPDFRLDIVGDGPPREELEALSARLGIQDQVHFLGHRDDVGDLLASADLFVASSISEGISLTLLEAMAAGLPVVSTDVGGNPEVVVHGETGLLVPPKSPQALAEAMIDVLRDPEKAGRMGQAGRRRAEEEFDVRRTVAQYEELYLSLAGKLNRPAKERPREKPSDPRSTHVLMRDSG